MPSFRHLALTAAFSAAPLTAQNAPPPPPSILVSTSSDVKITPDRASIRISVQTKGTTAAVAGAENAKRQSAVLESLRKLGLTNEQLSTTDYNVTPVYRYVQDREPILTGYTVTNTIVADIQDITTVGKILDTALGSGANMISSLDFYTSNTDVARRQAISNAITKARADADVAAKAAGGSITGLLELSIGGDPSEQPPRPMYNMMAKDAAAATPINPGQQTLSVTVSSRWSFVPIK